MPSPIAPERLDLWSDRFDRLLDHYDVNRDARGPGGDPDGRFVVVMRASEAVTGSELYRLVRTSGIVRAQTVAAHGIDNDWIPMFVFDLNTLTGDGRWPVRHDVAYQRTIVAFNTVPTPTTQPQED